MQYLVMEVKMLYWILRHPFPKTFYQKSKGLTLCRPINSTDSYHYVSINKREGVHSKRGSDKSDSNLFVKFGFRLI